MPSSKMSQLILILRKVVDTRWIGASELVSEMEDNPDSFAPWFKACIRDIFNGKSIWNHINDRQTLTPFPDIIHYKEPLI